MKKALSLLLVLLMLLGIGGCSGNIDADKLESIVNDAIEIADAVMNGEDAISELPDLIEEESPELPAEEEAAEEEASPAEEGTPAEEAAAPAEEENTAEETPAEAGEAEAELLDEHGSYTGRDEVALYIYQYGHLPDNFITKNEAQKLGWSGGSLEAYAPGKCIGGSRFGNYEGLLPAKDGRSYTECDIDTLGASSRGAKRIVFSNDGLIYYTDDHYASFTLLYGEE